MKFCEEQLSVDTGHNSVHCYLLLYVYIDYIYLSAIIYLYTIYIHMLLYIYIYLNIYNMYI
jgi:hypothetical protein